MIPNFKTIGLLALAILVLTGCDKDDPAQDPKDPDKAPGVSVDRFSPIAGHLMVRTSSNGLPAANAPVHFDMEPFITRGLTPTGQVVDYYNFDIQPLQPAPIYVLFRPGAGSPVEGQLNIINVLPGETGYNDFWQVHKVTVPANYMANTVASFSGIRQAGFTVEKMNVLVNCPVVPAHSTATKRLGTEPATINRGWYKDSIVYYFSFLEKALMTINDKVPLSPIYVTFNINPTQPNGGPPSGFRKEMGSMQTHNVIATVPANASYSPLWSVNVYDNASFGSVNNLATAQAAPVLGMGVATVNCPVVSIGN